MEKMRDIIQIAYGETQMALENEVMKAVCKVGINVNKEELIKAALHVHQKRLNTVYNHLGEIFIHCLTSS